MVNVANRAMMNASPRSPAVTAPSPSIFADVSLLVRNRASVVTSRSVPSEYLARTTTRCFSPAPSSTADGGNTSMLTGVATVGGSSGASASSQRTIAW